MTKGVFFSLLYSCFALAEPPSPAVPSFDSIEATREGNVSLQFTMGANSKLSIIDDDGIATLVTLQYMLLQQPSEDIYIKKTTWAAIKDKNVVGWDRNLRTIHLEALDKARAAYVKLEANTRGVKARKAMEAEVDQLDDIINRYKKLNRPLTYAELNQIGAWLSRNAYRHYYTEVIRERGRAPETRQRVFLLANDTANNPLGTALSSRTFFLPNERLSRSRMTFDVDLKKIGTRFMSDRDKEWEGSDKKNPGEPDFHKER